MIEATDIGFAAGGRDLLSGISLRLAPGEVLAVIGPNGAGKSTLLRLISGELRPKSGRITLGGTALSAIPPKTLARRRAVVAQSVALAFPMRVEDIVALGRLPWHGTPQQRRDPGAVAAALARAGIAHLARRHHHGLSGGERQRVQLARAFAQLDGATTPAALLLDEPTASLDVAHVATLLQDLRQLAADGLAILVILHDINEAQFVADRILVLNEGHPIALGPPEIALQPDLLARTYGIGFERLAGGAVLPRYEGAASRRGALPLSEPHPTRSLQAPRPRLL
jgi:iron complex transport system ATP-binding protein